MRAALAILLLLLLLPLRFQAEALILDRIVAVVNDDVITLSELKHLEAAVLRNRPEALEPGLTRERMLEDLIDKKIKLQRAEELKIAVSDEELDAAIAGILEQNRISEPDFREKLQDQGFSWAEYREEIRDQIVVSRLLNQEVRSKIVITPGEAEQYYREHLDRFAVEARKQILRILVSLPEDATPEQRRARRKRAEELLARVQSGEDFQETAMRYSEGPEAPDGGNLGFFASGELRQDLEEAIRGLEAGEITPVLEFPEGFALLKVEKVQAASHLPFEEVREKIQEALYQEKLRARYAAWLAELKGRAFIEKKEGALEEPDLPGPPPPRSAETPADSEPPSPEESRAPPPAAAEPAVPSTPAPATASAVPAPPSSEPTPPQEALEERISRWEQRLRGAPPDRYTIQVETSRNAASALHTLDRIGSDQDSMIVRVRTRSGEAYALLVGIYDSRGEAREALRRLPRDILGGTPLVRPISAVRKGLIPE